MRYFTLSIFCRATIITAHGFFYSAWLVSPWAWRQVCHAMHGMSRRAAAGLGHPMAGGECQDPRPPSFLWVDTWTWMKFVILPRDNIKTWESVRFYFVFSFFNLRIFSEHVSFGHKWRIYLGEHVNRCSQSNLRMLPKERQCQPWFVRCILPTRTKFYLGCEPPIFNG